MSAENRIIRHALWVILIGLLGGFGMAFAMIGEVRISPVPALSDSFFGDVASWRAVHIGCLTNGILALALAANLKRFAITDKRRGRIALAMMLTLWGNTVFYLMNIWAANRSLSFGDNALGESSVWGMIGYATAILAALALIWVVVMLILSGFKNQVSDD